jgi:hypothetical protein
MVINDGTITYEKFADSLKRKIGTIFYYTLQADEWENGTQEIIISNSDYSITENTGVNIHIDSDTLDLLLEYDCESLSVSTNNGSLIAEINGNIPDVDFTIQLTLIDIN